MKKLGKGLSELGLNELLGGVSTPVSAAMIEPESAAVDKLHHLPIYSLSPGEFQPRRHIDQAALEELAQSIRAQGLIQPLIVRAKANNRYEIIAGERRWRAAQLAGLETIPVVIRDISDQTAVAFGLIENIQRQDLNALEEAQAIQRLLQEFQLTHEAVAQAIGKSRSTITNLLRLLQLNDDVKNGLIEGRLEMGHAKALLTLTGEAQSECAQIVIQKNLSVRETEALVQRYLDNTPSKKPASQAVVALETEKNLAEKIGAKVTIRHNAQGKGKIVIHYHNLDELTGILSHIQ